MTLTPEQIAEMQADAKEIAAERREKHMESHMMATMIRNSSNPSAASGWEMAADYALRTAHILETITALTDEVARLTEALTLIERIYYMEDKPDQWSAAKMNAIANDAQNGKDLAPYRRLFPRTVLQVPK